MRTLAGGLPVLLWLFAALGMLWADVTLAERIAGLGGYHKLLVIPLLLAQFRRSERGVMVLYGFLASCTLLLAASFVLDAIFRATLYNPFPGKMPGLPARDYIAQSAEFLICAFALLAAAPIARARGARCWRQWFTLLALLFIANILYIATGRTALVVIALLLVILAFREFGWKGVRRRRVSPAPLSAASRGPLRHSCACALHKASRKCAATAPRTPRASSLRVEFWKKSLAFIKQAPVIGNGTGSMPELFRRAAAGATGAPGVISTNPHNQFFAVAIQLGIVGARHPDRDVARASRAVSRGGLVAWIGVVMVVQNVVASLFNSHLFDLPRLALRVRRRRDRRHGVACARRRTARADGRIMTAETARAPAHPGGHAAPARRRAADDTADPQPQRAYPEATIDVLVFRGSEAHPRGQSGHR